MAGTESDRASAAQGVPFGPPELDRPPATTDDRLRTAGAVPVRRLKSHLFHYASEDVAHTYAVIDGAATPDLLDRLYDSQPPFVCLYPGDLAPDMAEVAPYLVELEASHPFTDWLLAANWGKARGVFAQSGADLRRLRRHFRSFLMVYDPDNRPVYFRWYDPRVLRNHLPGCDAKETRRIFGPVDAYFAEDADPVVLLRFTPEGAVPVQESLVLVNANQKSGAIPPHAPA